MSDQVRPASARARRAASAPMLSAVWPGNRPNGCNPAPTIATSGTLYLRRGGEGEGDDLVVGSQGPERHQHEPHRHADPQRVLAAADQDALQPELPGQLDQPDEPRLERIS